MQESSNILNLSDLHLPEVPSWLPLSWGWWASLLAIVVVLVSIALIVRAKKKRMAPKKTALRLLNPALGHQTPSSAIELVRQAALCYYPREQVAHLTGPDWYAFLDSQVDSPIFTKNEETWQKALYQKQKVENAQDLVADCYQWVNTALPPQKRRNLSVGKY
ncbi:DUF4381 domain-containing protein [Vibrio diazotrophicus]|uniref:DUF4381 domain-containing protein n=1 Tax=Vibrio diazotrophicus TaxID=685 RepID=UPI000C9EA1C3|nr:DUF4381 domain-containing protein [Vibrio diazotrophicus]PNH93500.1 DUF4381 domain-containing protein [Vibrio diazotrophicus]